jgi:hypothetical protein
MQQLRLLPIETTPRFVMPIMQLHLLLVVIILSFLKPNEAILLMHFVITRLPKLLLTILFEVFPLQ